MGPQSFGLWQSVLGDFRRLLRSALSATIDECPPIELLTADCRICTYFGKGNPCASAGTGGRVSTSNVWGVCLTLDLQAQRCCQSMRDTEFHVSAFPVGAIEGSGPGHPQGGAPTVGWLGGRECQWCLFATLLPGRSECSMNPKSDSRQVVKREAEEWLSDSVLVAVRRLCLVGRYSCARAPALNRGPRPRRRRPSAAVTSSTTGPAGGRCAWREDLRSRLYGLTISYPPGWMIR